MNFLVSLLVAFGVPGFAFAAKNIEVASTWNKGAIEIDGMRSDWTAPLMPLKDLDIQFAACNDSQFLYVVWATTDRRTQVRVLGAGLTYWFDRTAADQKSFGIRSPICNRNVSLFKDAREGGVDDTRLLRESAQSSQAFELVFDKGKDVRLISAAQEDSFGIRTALFYKDSELVQELRIPLSGAKVSAMRPDSLVSLAIETCPIDFGASQNQSPSSGGEGEGPGMGGGGGFGGGGHGGHHGGGGLGGGGGHGGHHGGGGETGEGPRPTPFVPVTLWMSISLAQSSTTHPATIAH